MCSMFPCSRMAFLPPLTLSRSVRWSLAAQSCCICWQLGCRLLVEMLSFIMLAGADFLEWLFERMSFLTFLE